MSDPPATVVVMAQHARNARTRRTHGRRHPQLGFDFRTWGGSRPGAGRKPKGPRTTVKHRPRDAFARRAPLHVTIRIVANTCDLRKYPAFGAAETALAGGADRFGVQVVQFSVQGEHLHLMVEAPDAAALPRAVKGLSVRLARRVNRTLQRSGRLIADRFHSRRLRTPTEVARVKDYIRNNRRQHLQARGIEVDRHFVDPCSSDAPGAIPLPPPRTWLVKHGWKKAIPPSLDAGH